MENILVSVVVPIYNVDKYLSTCLNSIIHQSYQNLEILLIDDGSTDNSSQICKNYLKKDSRIKYFLKKNGGVSSARNFGLSNSHGEYICFVDSDDFIDKNYVKELLNFSVENNCDITICNYYEFDTKIQPYNFLKRYAGTLGINKIVDEKTIWDQFYFDKYGTKDYAELLVYTKIYKKSIFENFKFEGRIHEDEYSLHILFHIANKIGVITSFLYYYRRNVDNSITYKITEPHHEVIVKYCIKRIIHFIKYNFSNKLISKVNDMLIDHYTQLSKITKLKYYFKIRKILNKLQKLNIIDKNFYNLFTLKFILLSRFKKLIYKLKCIIKKI